MREILFRAKDNGVLNGIWQHGSLDISNPDAPEINRIDRYNNKMRIPVLIETVGQYTGLTDKNGKKIFEGDILESRASEIKEDWKIWQVGFEDGCFAFDSVRKSIKSRRKFKHEQNLLCVDEIELYGLEVIGNIHDNPDLLKGE